MENATATETKTIGLSFNGNAVSAFLNKMPSSNRFRVANHDGVMFLRPTDRKKGPHVFADFMQTPQAGSTLRVQLTDAQLDKLGINIEQGQKFGVQQDRYGWFFLTSDDSGIEGAKATVVKGQ